MSKQINRSAVAPANRRSILSSFSVKVFSRLSPIVAGSLLLCANVAQANPTNMGGNNNNPTYAAPTSNQMLRQQRETELKQKHSEHDREQNSQQQREVELKQRLDAHETEQN
jgi:hypothetical protein